MRRYRELLKSKRGRERGSPSLDLYFADEPSGPLLLFQHIRKTGGTSVRQVIHANYSADRHVLELSPSGKSARANHDWFGELWGSLGSHGQKTLVCAASHHANFLLPVLDRDSADVRPVTVLREPVDRVLSRYHFASEISWIKQLTLAEVYRDVEGFRAQASKDSLRAGQFFNGQSRALLDPHYKVSKLAYSAGPPQDAELWRERLFTVAARYTVGFRERLPEFVDELARTFGWRHVFLPHAKENRNRPAVEEVDEETLELVRLYNWLDVELYDFCLKARALRAR